MKPVTILVCALGGEGGGVLAEWLYDAAVRAGHAAQATSVPGVAQRTGATTYYLEIAPKPAAELGGRRPVFCLNPVPGQIDLLVSSELLETVRQIGNGMASPDRTRIVSSSARALTVMEKMQPGDGRLDDAALLDAVKRASLDAKVFDMAALAREAGTVISAVMLGAVAASGVLPFAREVYEEAIRASGKGVEASLRGFALGLAGGAEPVRVGRAGLSLQQVLALGRERLADYQDDAYADLFVQRVGRLGAGECAAEAARWLALWMAFDDIVRVAALKLRASRLARVRREVAARDDELVRVFDHFKPGVPEFAALLPEGLAAKLEAWNARRAEPWALPIRLGTHTVFGTLALRLVAALKSQRRRGRRFAQEQALIERWLGAVEQGLRRDPALGLELARCGRLIKGYGSTNERGKRNLLHIVDVLAPGGDAAAVRAAREAALADDAGRALDAALVAHGAPPRPVQPQPIRFHRRRPAGG